MRFEGEKVTWKSLAKRYLSSHNYDAARFYAERMYYDSQTAESLSLLAQCYFLAGKIKQTYLLLQDTRFCRNSGVAGYATTTTSVVPPSDNTSSEVDFIRSNQYLYALCCIQLGKWDEGEVILHPRNRILTLEQITVESVSGVIPGGADGVYLMGKICKRQHRKDFAKHYLNIALQMDPYHWSAITELSELGEAVDVPQLVRDFHQQHPISTHSSTKPHVSMPTRVLRSQDAATHGAHSALSTTHGHGSLLASLASDRAYLHAQSPAARQAAAQSVLETLTGERTELTPAVNNLSMRVPFASPGAMPSPLTNSMLCADRDSSAMGLMAHGQSSEVRAPAARMLFHHTPMSSATPLLSTTAISPFPEGDEEKDDEHHKDDEQVSVSQALLESSPIATTTHSRVSTTNLTMTTLKKKSHSVAATAAASASRRVSFGPNASQQQHPVATSSPALSPISGLSPVPSQHATDTPLFSLHDTHSKYSDFASHQHSRVSLASAHPHHETSTPWSVSSATPMAHVESDEDHLILVLSVFAEAQYQMHSFQSLACMDSLQKRLPLRHLRSGFASQLLGRALTEANEYHAAVRAFREMLRLEPFRTQGVETLSSALWHLKLDKELSSLAQQVVEVDKFSPEVWCVVGNCFSLQRETDAAIRFFHRALQLDSHFAYAHTLCGHEHVNNENIDEAIACFRHAIACNDRHYNAWYGLGSIYFRQERFELAEYHFRKARSINASSSVLDCFLGMALNAQGTPSKIQEALIVLSNAADRDPDNPQLAFQRAHILFSQNRLQDALSDLLKVEAAAPKEAPVHSMLGQIYQHLQNNHKAMMHFTIAMDLDPKEAPNILALMDEFGEPHSDCTL